MVILYVLNLSNERTTLEIILISWCLLFRPLELDRALATSSSASTNYAMGASSLQLAKNGWMGLFSPTLGAAT